MQVNVADIQAVGEVEATLFELVQQSTIESAVLLSNTGANTLNYRFQVYTDGDWVNLGDVGSIHYDALLAGETKLVTVDSGNTKIRVVGNASGGSTLWFSVSRFVARQSGGAIPLVSL